MLKSRSALGEGTGGQTEHHASLALSTIDIFLSLKLLGEHPSIVYQAPLLGKRLAIYRRMIFDQRHALGRGELRDTRPVNPPPSL